MKNICIYLIIIETCLLSSCKIKNDNGTLPIKLVQAENLMYENPDSALRILQGMEVPIEKEAHATWALLLTQAKYKCDIVQSDTLINKAYNYFKDSENIQKKTLSLFCKAALYEEQNKIEEALKFYLDGANTVGSTTDYRLAHLINVRLGILYAVRDLYDYAIEYCEKAHEYAILSKDTYYITNSYNNLARVYSVQEKYEKAIVFYDKAIEFGNAYKAIKALNFALQEKAGIYIRLKKYDEALLLMKKIETSQLTLPGFQILGHLYSKIHKEDSAYYYLDKALLTNDIYVLRSAYQVLFNLSKETNNYKKNAEYSIKLWSINDSINKIDRNKVLIEMQEKYNQQKIINEKNKAEKRGLIIFCVSIGIIGVIIVCYQWKILRQKKELEDKRDELNALNEQLTENKNIIAQNEERMAMVAQVESVDMTEELKEKEAAIENMRNQNETLKKDNQELMAKIEQREAVLQEKSKDTERLNQLTEKNAYLRKRETFLSAQLLKMDGMIVKLKNEPDCFKDYQWEELREKTDALFDGYTERLLKRVPTLTTHDIHICCLIKLSFSHIAIADILGISPTSVSRQKQRLKERIVQQVGSLGENVLLDIWLKEF